MCIVHIIYKAFYFVDNINSVKEKLGRGPKVSFDEGLRQTVEYFRKVLAN